MNSVHIDIRRQAGLWTYTARHALGTFSQGLAAPTAERVAEFIENAVVFHRRSGRRVDRIVTDQSKQCASQAVKERCARLGLHQKARAK